ncbi:sensor histidine kinase KdpD [Thiomicrospira sp. ALE5]|uniref:sensor histidine kinase n=1 Tax=Thiomicrospira sp. ALE5 TaxID=748650 RepID=UPI0008E79509|nr:HAMP domain-containing sensor histidine kinase [Thiomicrospira sp. ALE5]SFR49923.1 Signal transduction histidine kinase [Thiomicrospira sp. ALE5]
MAPIKASLKQQFAWVVLLLALLPALVFKLSFDIQNQQLSNQISDDLKQVNTLARLLAASKLEAQDKTSQQINEYWSHQLDQLHQTLGLDIDHQAIWLVNQQGQVFSVHGWLNPQPSKGIDAFWQRFLLHWQPIYQQADKINTDSVDQFIRQSLQGETLQVIRQEGLFPASLMSSAPFVFSDPSDGQQHQGSVVFEQTLTTLVDRSISGLSPFLFGLMLLLIIWGLAVLVMAAHVSWRIKQVHASLNDGVMHLRAYNQACYHSPQLPIKDEVNELSEGIAALFNQLADYQRYLNTLPSTLNHELHNPLNRLNLALARLNIDEQQKRPLLSAVSQITTLTQRLTEAQNLKQSIADTQLQPLNISARINDYFYQVVDYLGQQHIDFKPLDSAEVNIMADGYLLEQLFDKLIDNAVSFHNGQRPIQINCQLQKNDMQGTYLAISICNTGPKWPLGVDPRNEFFSQRLDKSEHSLTQDEPHLGLGLYLADLIAKRHKGHLVLDNYSKSELSGVCVTVILPCLNKR